MTGRPAASRSWGEISFLLALTVLGCGLAVFTPDLIKGYKDDQPYYIKSAFFPWLALALVVGFGAWSVGQTLRGVKRDLSDELDVAQTSVPRALGGAFVMALYVGLCATFGFPAATLIGVFLFARVSGLAIGTCAILACFMTLLLYAVFVLAFKVWFSPGLLIKALT